MFYLPLAEWLSENSLPLANIKGISFSHAQMDFSEVGAGKGSPYDTQHMGRKLEAEASSKALGLSYYLHLTTILDVILQL